MAARLGPYWTVEEKYKQVKEEQQSFHINEIILSALRLRDLPGIAPAVHLVHLKGAYALNQILLL